jgi:hypothetical protein
MARDKALLDTSGIQVQSYREVCQEMVKKLRHKVDYLILLTDLRNNVLDSLVQANPGIDLILTTGSYSMNAMQMTNSKTLLVGTGFRGQDATLLEFPFDLQRPDSLIYRQVQKPLTEDIKEDSTLAALVTECKPKPIPAKIIPPKESEAVKKGETSLGGPPARIKPENATPPTTGTLKEPTPGNR